MRAKISNGDCPEITKTTPEKPAGMIPEDLGEMRDQEQPESNKDWTKHFTDRFNMNQITDVSIADAKIVGLTANKITAETLSAERLETQMA